MKVRLKHHEFRDLVNELRDTADRYGGTDQLRDQLSHTLARRVRPVPEIVKMRPVLERIDARLACDVLSASSTVEVLRLARDEIMVLAEEVMELRAALQHEADCVEAAKAEVEVLRDSLDEHEALERRHLGDPDRRTGVYAHGARMAPDREFLESVIALCSHRGPSPSSIESFEPEDKWIADLWRRAMVMLSGAQPAPSVPTESIGKMLAQVMEAAVANGANSVSMPDELVEVAAWLSGVQPNPANGQTRAVRDVIAERRRQIEVEGRAPEHDDRHGAHELAEAAACYCLSSAGKPFDYFETMWPWERWWFKVSDPRRDLVKAGALVLAEIERLDRAAAPKPESE